MAVFLAASAFIEIRRLAAGSKCVAQDNSPDEVLDHIGSLAKVESQPPGRHTAKSQEAVPPGHAPLGSCDQAMAERPMSRVWNTAGPSSLAFRGKRASGAGRPGQSATPRAVSRFAYQRRESRMPSSMECSAFHPRRSWARSTRA